ncbi:MAG: hypothetical protein ACREQ1_16475 [Woeseiaceae bacterium]
MCSASAAAQPAQLSLLTTAESQAAAAQPSEPRSGQRDFDFSIGTWVTRVSLLQNPLTGSTTWAKYEGTSVVRKVMNGRANLVELDVAGPAGRIEGVSLRLYNPRSRQWSLHYSNSSGIMSPPVFGGFKDGRGEFIGLETIDGRAILVRFVITNVDEDSWRFEQSYSDDGGKSWEANWIAIDTLMKGESDESP